MKETDNKTKCDHKTNDVNQTNLANNQPWGK